MAGATFDNHLQLGDAFSMQATAMLGPNVRARGRFGRLGTQADFVTFAGAPTVFGFWVKGNTRTWASGSPLVSSSSQGVTQLLNLPALPPTVPGPPLVPLAPNPRIISF